MASSGASSLRNWWYAAACQAASPSASAVKRITLAFPEHGKSLATSRGMCRIPTSLSSAMNSTACIYVILLKAFAPRNLNRHAPFQRTHRRRPRSVGPRQFPPVRAATSRSDHILTHPLQSVAKLPLSRRYLSHSHLLPFTAARIAPLRRAPLHDSLTSSMNNSTRSERSKASSISLKCRSKRESRARNLRLPQRTSSSFRGERKRTCE